MSTLATDDFNRANGALGANWATINGGATFAAMTIVSNRASSGVDPCGNRYTAATLPNNQWAQGKITGPATAGNVDDGIGPGIRIASAADSAYYVTGQVAVNNFMRVLTGTFSALKTDAVGTAANSILYIEAQGTTLLAKKDGANLFGGAFTDSGISSGQGGMMGSGAPDTVTLDDWAAGDFVVPSTFASYEQFPKPTMRQPLTPGTGRTN